MLRRKFSNVLVYLVAFSKISEELSSKRNWEICEQQWQGEESDQKCGAFCLESLFLDLK